MLPVLRSAWARSPRPLCLARATASRPASTNTKLSKYVLKRPNPLALQLAKTGIWTVTDRPGAGRPRKLKSEKEDGDGDGEKPKRKRGRPKKEETEPIEEETVEIKEEIKEDPIVEDIFQDDSIRSKPGPKKRGDKYRVNITDEKLCDDIIKYLRPTLKRHIGCDLVDINPGSGLWSTKLNDALRPRSHTLMEPDKAVYEPFLEPLLKRPNTRLVHQSGIVWNNLVELLNHIPNQQAAPRGPDIEPQRNDTLLVTANLAFFPKKKYRSFDSVTMLVLYQLINSISAGALFQKYGLVRMLVWTGPDDHKSYIPKTMQRRKKGALEVEFSCEYMAEVAGVDEQAAPDYKGERLVRDMWIDVDSTLSTLRRMRRERMTIPRGRKMMMTKLAEDTYRLEDGPFAGVKPPQVTRIFEGELEKLEKMWKDGLIEKYTSKDWKRMVYLRRQSVRVNEEMAEHKELVQEMQRISQLRQEGSLPEEEISALEKKWNDEVRGLGKNGLIAFQIYRDNMHLFMQDPPVMSFDRRPYEPMVVQPEHFFPNVPCTLLDIQPKAIHPMLRESGPGTSRAGDMFDLIRTTMMLASVEPVSKVLDRVWPGAAEGVLPNCPSLRDPAKGGMNGKEFGEICPRALNQDQWMELLRAFVEWPFRPTYEELIGRLVEPDGGSDGVGDEDNTGSHSSAEYAIQ